MWLGNALALKVIDGIISIRLIDLDALDGCGLGC